ncbi:MAG: hypothetical protein LBS59_02615 [Puniceicoccales bacterium]|nr:hypothetical protein [Puniceicoccales bacterium]
MTDGKAVGTYLEHRFQDYLSEKYAYARGSSAKGIDFPEFGVDIKVTALRSHNHLVHSSPPGKKSTASATVCSFLFMKRQTTIQRAQGD